ncbi:hypothetical protein BH10BAC3_BH10BAC3_22200 [soil metagenome]
MAPAEPSVCIRALENANWLSTGAAGYLNKIELGYVVIGLSSAAASSVSASSSSALILMSTPAIFSI